MCYGHKLQHASGKTYGLPVFGAQMHWTKLTHDKVPTLHIKCAKVVSVEADNDKGMTPVAGVMAVTP